MLELDSQLPGTSLSVRVLGCSGAIGRGVRTTSFLIDDRLLVDCGTGVGDLTLEEMAKVDHVLLTHTHVDHIAALPLMLDAVGSMRTESLVVHALPATIADLQAHIFNGIIWPDFTAIPYTRPYLRFEPLAVGEQLDLCGHLVEVLPASHTVPAVGYGIQATSGWWVFTGDTDHHLPFWQRINQLPLAMLVIEAAFSNQEKQVAKVSKHHCPDTLIETLAYLAPPPEGRIRVGITHTKPSESERIRAEVTAMGVPAHIDLVWLETGMELEF